MIEYDLRKAAKLLTHLRIKDGPICTHTLGLILLAYCIHLIK